MIDIYSYNFSKKRALIRVDFNVPINKQTLQITDDTRIRASIPTIKYILNKGGSVVLMSHLGRPKEVEQQYSLKQIVNRVGELLGKEVKFSSTCVGEKAIEMSANLQSGEVLLLENLRFYPQETKGEESFAQELAKHGDVYVNDAFGTAHRAHASTTIIANYFPKDKLCGLLLEKEIKAANQILNSTKKPFTAIIGGAKVSSKISIIEKLLTKVDNLIIGGGMAYTFIKAMGGKIGNSIVENDFLDTARNILQIAKQQKVQIILPTDSFISDKFEDTPHKKLNNIYNIPDGWLGLDIGTESIEEMQKTILESKLILCNGPMGVFEFSNFQNGTLAVAKTIAEATQNGAFSLIGGGDSVAAIHLFQLESKVSYVSTGGGAMLEYLEGKTLPGIKALLKN